MTTILAETGPCLDRGEERPYDSLRAAEEWCRSSARRWPEEALPRVGMTGTLVGRVVDPCGLPMLARVLVRDRTGAVVRECYPTRSRAGRAQVRFEVRGLAAGTYMLEVAAPGFWELHHSVRIEAACLTDVGIVRLIWAKSPRIVTPPVREADAGDDRSADTRPRHGRPALLRSRKEAGFDAIRC
jgi:hypothetical protein